MVYGGNTSCVEVEANGYRFVLDSGTGVRHLGKSMMQGDAKTSHVLLTHTHWDHINGFPFFMPAYDKDHSLHIMAGHLKPLGRETIQDILSTQMHNPMFPVPLETMRANLRFEDFEAGDNFDLAPDVAVRTAPLNHPNGATGYRIDSGGKSLCYVTDTEHVPGKMDENILGLIEGADLMIYDSTYTEAEFPAKVGWGHSTWNEGMRLAKEANVKRMAIFHHDPEHTDTVMEEIEKEARDAWDGNFASREGMEIVLE